MGPSSDYRDDDLLVRHQKSLKVDEADEIEEVKIYWDIQSKYADL